MTAIIDTDHVRRIIASCKAKPLPVEASRGFAAYLETCPFLPSRVDWSRMPSHSAIEWSSKSDQDVLDWARTLRIGKYDQVAVWYGPDEPGLLTGFEFGVANLDTLTWNAPGPRYLFGVKIQDGVPQYAFDAFIETSDGGVLHGVA